MQNGRPLIRSGAGVQLTHARLSRPKKPGLQTISGALLHFCDDPHALQNRGLILSLIPTRNGTNLSFEHAHNALRRSSVPVGRPLGGELGARNGPDAPYHLRRIQRQKLVGSALNRYGALSVLPDCQAGNAQERRLLLNASRIGHNHG